MDPQAQENSAQSKPQQTPQDITDEIRILDGQCFLITTKHGDFGGAPTDPYGLFYEDTRFLSKFVMLLNGQTADVITSKAVDYYSSAHFLSNKSHNNIPERSISVTRMRVVQGGLHEEIRIENYNDFNVEVTLEFQLGTDFADLFEVKAAAPARKRQIDCTISDDKTCMCYTYRRDHFFRRTEVHFSRPGEMSAGNARFQIQLPGKGMGQLEVDIELQTQDVKLTTIKGSSVFESSEDELVKALSHWQQQLPALTTDFDLLNHVYKRSCIDLAALRLHTPKTGGEFRLPAAGLPWFMTLFGRDTLIASYQSMIVGSRLSEGALLALAARQGSKVVNFQDEEPGKILHELRHGELTTFGAEPFGPYFGSIDSTMLFLILAGEHYRWTADHNLVRKLRPNFERALEWITKYGDRDGDGYVEYETRSPKGLHNQGWKDSWNAIQFNSGELAKTPIALCEVQGYTYAAYQALAELSAVWGDKSFSQQMRDAAAKLKDNFNRDFWLSGRGGYFAVALDGDKRAVDSKCSNMGQALWTGILDASKAQAVVNQLMADHLYSGWGVRTMSLEEKGFNPIGYHIGTVWPHDNSLIAAGLRRYGFTHQANRIITSLLEASSSFDHRLPEAFAGYRKGRLSFPARYPTSCSPQAWASGAPLLFLRVLLGLDADPEKRQLVVDPVLPPSIKSIELNGVSAFGRRWRVAASEGKAIAEPLEENRSVA